MDRDPNAGADDIGRDADSGATEPVREAVERPQHGTPAAGAVVRDRFDTDEV